VYWEGNRLKEFAGAQSAIAVLKTHDFSRAEAIALLKGHDFTCAEAIAVLKTHGFSRADKTCTRGCGL
jgi:hypothetical protein